VSCVSGANRISLLVMSVINIKIVLVLGNFIYIRSESVCGVTFFCDYLFVDSQYLFFGCIYDRSYYTFY